MPTIQELAGVGDNWVPVEGKPIVPGRNNSYAAPPGFASVVNSVPKYNVGSIAPNFQHDVSFVDTQQPTPATPQLHLMPLGLAANSVSSTQITSVVKTTVVPTPSSTLFYQTMESGGSPQVQRPALNIINGTVSDNALNNSTDFELWYQTIQLATTSKTQRPNLNFTPAAIFSATDNAGNSSTDIALNTDVASGVPTLDSSALLKAAEFPAFTGDVSKPSGSLATTVVAIQGTAVINTPPLDTQVLQYVNGATKWEPQYLAETVNAQTGTTYTVQDSDRTKLITFSNVSAVAVSLPQAGASSLFVAGWYADFSNINTGAVTITPTTSTINGLSSITLVKGESYKVISDGTNYQIACRYIVGTPSDGYVPTYVAANKDIEWKPASSGSGIGGVNVQTSGPYTILPGDNGKDVVANSASAISFLLPASPPSATFTVFIENINTGALTVDRNGLTIDGAASNLTIPQNQGIVVFTDGTNYFTERGLVTGTSAVTSLNGLTGALSITGGTNVVVTPSGSNVQISINFADNETPSGSTPGTSFTLAHSPSPVGSLQLFWNGQLLKAGGADYTLSGTGITTVNTIAASDVLLAWYRY